MSSSPPRSSSSPPEAVLFDPAEAVRDDDLAARITWPAPTAAEWAASEEAGRAWNDAARNRPGNPENEKFRKTFSRSTTQEDYTPDPEEGEDETIGPDADIGAFLARCQEKHRAYWETPPPVIPGLASPCHRCSGTGRAPSPLGHVRCGLCGGSGEEPDRPKRPRKRTP